VAEGLADEYSKKDKGSLAAFAENNEHRNGLRKKAFTVMMSSGRASVLSPRILDLCEMASSPLSHMCGASLFSELMKPALFRTPASSGCDLGQPG